VSANTLTRAKTEGGLTRASFLPTTHSCSSAAPEKRVAGGLKI
jgi:hypothetical protein